MQTSSGQQIIAATQPQMTTAQQVQQVAIAQPGKQAGKVHYSVGLDIIYFKWYITYRISFTQYSQGIYTTDISGYDTESYNSVTSC